MTFGIIFLNIKLPNQNCVLRGDDFYSEDNMSDEKKKELEEKEAEQVSGGQIYEQPNAVEVDPSAETDKLGTRT